MRVFSIREMGWTPWPHFYNHMVWELWETTMSSILNVLKIFGFGHWRHWYQMSVPSSAQLVQPPSPTPFWSSFAGAQVEANFSDAETSLQLAEVGDVKWCPNSKPKLPELRKKQTAWRVSTIFISPYYLRWIQMIILSLVETNSEQFWRCLTSSKLCCKVFGAQIFCAIEAGCYFLPVGLPVG